MSMPSDTLRENRRKGQGDRRQREEKGDGKGMGEHLMEVCRGKSLESERGRRLPVQLPQSWREGSQRRAVWEIRD